MPGHVYFDLDGTLTDPYEGISRCIIYALERLGFAHPGDEFLHNCMGPPLYETFPKIVGEALTLSAVDLYRERFDEIGWQENVPYDGILDVLAEVKSAGHSLFVATSKPRIAAGRIVEHFGLAPYFDRVFGCELDGTRSNKADLLRYAIAKNPPAPARIMIGDRKHDLIGAAATGMHPVGVSYGYGSVAELEQAGAASIAKTPSEIPGIVDNAFS
ncbi:MAG: HAD hydrolase-like protein [Gammaproteobacteria bacterium]|nr:HAD hydrolase-like protein [Gammaproteobacteria bacterium]